MCACVNFILNMGLWARSVMPWLSSTSVCFFLCLYFRCIHASMCAHLIGCQAGSWRCLGVLPCMFVCVCGWKEAMSHCGPPARPCDSWGPLRQLRPTARSDSLIMGGLLLWFPNTHSDTCTHTRTNHPSPRLLWPYPWVLSNQSTAGATCPSKKGKVALFDISIKLPYQDKGVALMLVFLWWQRIRTNLLLLYICFAILPCVCLCFGLSLWWKLQWQCERGYDFSGFHHVLEPSSLAGEHGGMYCLDGSISLKPTCLVSLFALLFSSPRRITLTLHQCWLLSISQTFSYVLSQ